MKIAVICDTHFGARSDSPTFAAYFWKFFDEVFFPYLDKNQIKHVIHLGDLLDRRKYVNFNTLHQVKTKLIQELQKRKVETHLLLGNHDCYFKNTNELNSPTLLFDSLKSELFHIYDSPQDVNVAGTTFAFLPWIADGEEQRTFDYLSKTESTVCFGHLEIQGYQLLRGVKCEHGLDSANLSIFRSVYTGHFHQKHSDGNVHYLGTPYQITFNDLQERKGFHVYDTETDTMEFVENPNRMFHRFNYDDSSEEFQTWVSKSPKLSFLENTHVMINVKCKQVPYLFEKFMDSVYAANPGTVRLIDYQENAEYAADQSDGAGVDVSKDTLSIIYKEIDNATGIPNVGKLKSILQRIYNTAHQMETDSQ